VLMKYARGGSSFYSLLSDGLFIACEKEGNVMMASLLITSGADVGARSHVGRPKSP
jgi:hypothetical protein